MSKRLQRLAIIMLLPVIAVTSVFYPEPKEVEASPVTCANSAIAFGRQNWCGYFNNSGYSSGDSVRSGGIPSGISRVNNFIAMIEGDLNSGNSQRVTGAQFLILTMIGRGPGAPKSVSSAQLDDWKERLRSYADTSENGWTSFGENGRIDWYVWTEIPCTFYKTWNPNPGWRGVNTYYQYGNRNDVAPYLVTCGAGTWEEFILIRDTNGNVIYRIRRACLNPIGQIDGLKKPQPDKYDLQPSITATVNGVAVSGGVEEGQTIRFEYGVRNNGQDPSPNNTNCTIYTNVHVGFAAARSNPPPGGGPGPGTGCPRSFPALAFTPVGSAENVPAVGNRTFCRSLIVSPATVSIPQRGVEACVAVVNKPYLKVYGGDVSVGGGQITSPGTCTANPRPAIISWSRGSSVGYAGASVQFAAVALSKIYEVSSSFGNSGGSVASRPSGLAFANVSSPNGSVYGGDFGALPCMKDYYADKPSSPQSFTSLAATTSNGAYEWNGAGHLNLSGAVPNGRRITLYVQGNVFINGDITYPATWASGSTPLLELVVKGNIYIGNGVNRIDGVFIAQKDGNTGGTIYTCALGAAALVPDGALHNRCNRKLTINGAFAANSVQFLRTIGTRHRATINEPRTSGNIAEVFNFSPALWMAQPVGSDTGADYDSITSLPPVL